MRVLFVCTQSPAPAHGGAALRMQGWLRTVDRSVRVGLAVLTRSLREERELGRLAAERGWWLATWRAPRSRRARLRDRLVSVLTGRPHLLTASRDRGFLALVQHALEEFRPRVMQAEQIGAAPYLAAARSVGIPTVYSAHNVESRILAGIGDRTSETPRWKATAARRN